MLKLPGHARYAYSPIVERKDYSWPGGKRLAFYVALNIEHFAFGAGLGMDPAIGACSKSWTSSNCPPRFF